MRTKSNRLPDPPYKIEDHGYLTPCWIWLGCKRKGYGLISNPDYHGSGAKMIGAHIYMYEKIKGPVPNKSRTFVPDHLCDVRDCVNPDHIEWKTAKENIQRGNRAVIIKEIAEQIREDYKNDNVIYATLAYKYKISISTVSQIITGKTW